MSRYKVAIVSLCLNQPYWQYASDMIASGRKHLLKDHNVDFILFTDMPVDTKIDAKIIPTEAFPWPAPTLFRYSVMLKQEELFSSYDFVFFCDIDMKFVSRVGDEILGDLVAAQHPMYAIRQGYIPPYEPNPNSASFIPRLGKVLTENNKKRFQPYYLAGGFQGGRSDVWIKAMKEMKEMIDKDFMENNYVPVWNDETAWNAYMHKNYPLMENVVVLNPSYIYPDSLINEYYRPLWGRNFVPKLITITKKFSLTKEGGANLNKILNA